MKQQQSTPVVDMRKVIQFEKFCTSYLSREGAIGLPTQWLCVYMTFCSCICVFLVTTLPSESVHVEEVVVTTTTSETHAVVRAVD